MGCSYLRFLGLQLIAKLPEGTNDTSTRISIRISLKIFLFPSKFPKSFFKDFPKQRFPQQRLPFCPAALSAAYAFARLGESVWQS